MITEFEQFLNERKYESVTAKEGLPRSKSIGKEMKELIMQYVNSSSTYKNKKVYGLSLPKIKGKNFKGNGLGADKKGFFVYTHRCRSHSYPTPADIPQSKIDFVASTG